MAPTLPETLPKASTARIPGSSNPVEREYVSLRASNVLMSIAEYLPKIVRNGAISFDGMTYGKTPTRPIYSRF